MPLKLVRHVPAILLMVLALTWSLSDSLWAAPQFQVLHAFTGGKDGGGLDGGVILDEAGNVYGETFGGGSHIFGVAFELSPSSGGGWTETVLRDFCSQSKKVPCSDGAGPLGGLVSDGAGNLYGTTEGGGRTDRGVIFELTPGESGWSYKVLYQAGSGPMALDGAGNLYGAISAGKYGAGAIDELVRGSSGWTDRTLHSFDLRKGHHDGFFPASAPIFDAKGNLYDTTEHGGINGDGIVFELTPPPPDPAPKEWSEHILHSFPAFSGDGQQPYSGLVFDSSGNLYGATAGGGTPNSLCPSGCGTIFKLTPGLLGEWKETILHKFVDPWNGAAPVGTLVFDRAGNLYGATAGGGKSQNCNGGCGAVFKMTPDGNGKWNYTVLHRFTGNDGANPQAGLTLDKKGNLYGTTIQGGKGFYGVVYEITP